MSTDKITIVIPCYWANDELIETTLTCINSVNDTCDVEEVLLIDDGSPEKLILEDNTDFRQRFTIITRENNGGYAAAVNTGLFYATGDIIIISNNDVEFIDPKWLYHLLKPLEEGFDISSIRTTDSDGWETEERIEEDAYFGSIWAIRRHVYDSIGGLNETFRKGTFEDKDYYNRAKAAGFRIAKNHAGLVQHAGRATNKVVFPNFEDFEEGKGIYKSIYGRID